LAAFPKQREKGEKAMIARLDHHPMLTALLALTTAVLVVVVITLSTLLITSAPTVSPSSVGDGGNAGAAAPANMGAGAAENPGFSDFYSESRSGDSQAGNGADSIVDRKAEMIAAYHNNR